MDITFGQQGRLGLTHSATLMQPPTRSEQSWGIMLLDCVRGLLRMQDVEYIYAEIHRLSEFMHILVISSEYRATQMIELSIEEMIRVQEQPKVVSSDRSRIPLPVFEIEYCSRFVDFT